MTITTEERQFLDAIADEPDNEIPVRVYSDWLMENGQHERGESLQQEIGKPPSWKYLDKFRERDHPSLADDGFFSAEYKWGMIRRLHGVYPDSESAIICALAICVVNPVTQISFHHPLSMGILPTWFELTRYGETIHRSELSKEGLILFDLPETFFHRIYYIGLSGRWGETVETDSSGMMTNRGAHRHHSFVEEMVSKDFIRFAKQCRIENDVLFIRPDGATRLGLNSTIPLLSTCYGSWSFLGKFANQSDSDRLAINGYGNVGAFPRTTTNPTR